MISEGFWWITLAGATASAAAHLATMLGTRWGDRAVSSKALLFSILTHVALFCGLFAVGPDLDRLLNAKPVGTPERATAIDLTAISADVDPQTSDGPGTDDPRRIWERPSEGPNLDVTRRELTSETKPEAPETRASVAAARTPRELPDPDDVPIESPATPELSQSEDAAMRETPAPTLPEGQTAEARAEPPRAYERTDLPDRTLAASELERVEDPLAADRTRPATQPSSEPPPMAESDDRLPAAVDPTADNNAIGTAAPGPAEPDLPVDTRPDEVSRPRGIGAARFGRRWAPGRDLSAAEPTDGPVRSEGRSDRTNPPARLDAPVLAASPIDQPEVQSPVKAGAIFGTVTDAATGRPLSEAVVRIDRASGDPLTAVTSADGTYEIALIDIPETFAVTSVRRGYLNGARGVRRTDALDLAVRVDFALAPEGGDVITVESASAVRHVGNDKFEGAVNARFQRASEGAEITVRFALPTGRLRQRPAGATIRLVAKGVQCPPELWVNGIRLPETIPKSPVDGSFAPAEVALDPLLLRSGENRITVRAMSCTGDLDDFEFVNVEVRLER